MAAASTDYPKRGRFGGLKRAAVQKQIKAAAATLRFVPPYGPDFNPIERNFSRLEAILREAGACTVSGPWDMIGRLVDVSKPGECANYLTAMPHTGARAHARACRERSIDPRLHESVRLSLQVALIASRTAQQYQAARKTKATRSPRLRALSSTARRSNSFSSASVNGLVPLTI